VLNASYSYDINIDLVTDADYPKMKMYSRRYFTRIEAIIKETWHNQVIDPLLKVSMPEDDATQPVQEPPPSTVKALPIPVNPKANVMSAMSATTPAVPARTRSFDDLDLLDDEIPQITPSKANPEKADQKLAEKPPEKPPAQKKELEKKKDEDDDDVFRFTIPSLKVEGKKVPPMTPDMMRNK
jgi:hypothetical protein